VYGIYFARCMNIFNSLLPLLVKYDVHTTRKINSIHAIFYHILSFYQNCFVLGCVIQCSQSAAHSCEQFLQVQQIVFVTLGPFRYA